MVSVLQQIVNGDEGSSMIVIQDSVDVSGRPLLRCLTNELANRVDEVHVFVFDRSPNVFLAGFDTAVRSKVVCHDGWSDPMEWNGIHRSDISNLVHLHSLNDFTSHIEQSVARGVETIAVVIDSLTPVILHKSITMVCRGLHRLMHTSEWEGPIIRQTVGLIHGDVHDLSVVRAVRHLASTVFHLEPYRSTAPVHEEPTAICEVVHRRKSGKTIRLREGISVDHDYKLFVFQDKGSANLEVEDQPQPDPTANLTFNLTLRDSERKAKDQVLLPYTKVQQRHTVKIGTESSGQIFYEPDEADDLDEEDPDGDLDV